MDRAIREQVLEQIIDVMVAAKAQGRRHMQAARETFPSTPDIVLFEAETAMEMREVEGWWRQIERTIDGEVIRRALAAQTGGASGDPVPDETTCAASYDEPPQSQLYQPIVSAGEAP